MNPNQLTVDGSFFLETHANFTSSWGNESKRGQTLIGVTMHGNMYVSRAAAFVLLPAPAGRTRVLG